MPSVTIDKSAPAFAQREAEIAADRETVWAVLTDFESWPSWHPDVRSISLEGGVTEGSVFRWKIGSTSITSTIQKAEAPRRIAWTGKAFGLHATHVWEFTERQGATVATTEETFQGPLARLMRGQMQKALDRGLTAHLEHLKTESERRAASAGT